MIERKFFIAGVQFRQGAADVIRTLKEGDILDLELEPDNKYDPNAVKIMDGTTQLGYVPKTLSAEISAAMEIDNLVAVVSTLNKDGKPWELCEVTIVPEKFEEIENEDALLEEEDEEFDESELPFGEEEDEDYD